MLLLGAWPAQAAELWTHPASGIALPERFGSQRIAQKQDLGTPQDSVVNYEAEAGVESTTIYIFRASVPNVPLWFERALSVVEGQIPLDLFAMGETEPVQAFGSQAPVGLQRIYATETPGPFKSTSMTVAQADPWLVKIRASSATLDRAGLKARIADHLAAIEVPTQLRVPPDLQAPPACPIRHSFSQSEPLSSFDEVESAAAMGTFVFMEMHQTGPTASGRCRVADNPLAGTATLLARDNEIGGWILLVGDAGAAVTVTPLDLASPSGAHVLFASTPAGTKGVGVFKGQPSPQQGLVLAFPVLTRRSEGMFMIAAESANK